MKTQRTIILTVAVIVIVAGLFFFRNNIYPQNSAGNTATTSPITGAGALDKDGNPISINVLPENLPTPPDMGGEIVFPSGYSGSNKITIIEKIESLRKTLKANPTDSTSWIEIGSYWRMIEDFPKAEAAWIYATKLEPANSVPLGNLGFLFGYLIHDNVKAEQYFLKAIEVAPNEGYPYFQTAEFYRDAVKDIPKAKAILDKGLKVLPKDAGLKALRNSLNAL
jgi:tetratricopeptide (TPR) repeat protein